MPKPESYTGAELLDMLKLRQGGMTQQQYAKEIGLSMQMLSQIYQGVRSIGNRKVLEYLAPKGKVFSHRDVWMLVDK